MHVILFCPQINSSDLLLSCAVYAAKTVAVLEDYPNKEGGRPYRPETCRSRISLR